MQENQIKGTAQLTGRPESVNFINKKFQEYKQHKREKECEIRKLKENINTLSKRLNDPDSVIDRQEQYSCQNCLLLVGLEEKPNGNTNQCVIDVLSESMGETISIQDLDQTYTPPEKRACY